MTAATSTRRRLLTNLSLLPASAAGQNTPTRDRELSVVCVGGHPDDPESGCGGTLARYSAAGHKLSIIYLTRGERGIRGKAIDEAGAIRMAEAKEACRILGAHPLFAGQIDGATEVNQQRVAEFSKLLLAQAPDIVFTHWPIDSHMDHQVAGVLTLRALFSSPRKFRLYFYEVNAGAQTQGFRPTDYVDITAVLERKKSAFFAHKSQNPEDIYRRYHEIMENFRGREARIAAAEAFVHLCSDSSAAQLL